MSFKVHECASSTFSLYPYEIYLKTLATSMLNQKACLETLTPRWYSNFFESHPLVTIANIWSIHNSMPT